MNMSLLVSLLGITGFVCAGQMPSSEKRLRQVPVAKIAIVDFQKIINMEDPLSSASLEWRDLAAEAEKKLKPRLEDLQKKKELLQKEMKAFQQNMSEDGKARCMKLENEIRIDADTYQSYSSKVLSEMQAQFGDKAPQVVEEVGKELGATLVLPGPVLYVDKAADITDDVIERLNAKYRAEQRAKKFKAEQAGKTDRSESLKS